MKTASRQSSAAAAAAILGLAFALPAAAHDPSDKAQLGKVHFKVECNAEAQKAFNVAMAYFHSFA